MKKDGFTLIEMALIITIVGILAVSTIPLFYDVSESAETSSVESIQGSLESNIMLLHSRFVVTGEAYSIDDIISDIKNGGANLTIEDL